MDILQIVLTAFITVLGSSGIWTYLDHRRAAREAKETKMSTEDQAIRDIVKALARYELVRASLSHIERGSITVEEADALTELYEPYELLGGNGNGKRLYEQAQSLPRRTGRQVNR